MLWKEDGRREGKQSQPGATALRRRRRILVVDAETDIAHMLELAHEMDGVVVQVATDAASAVQLCEKQPPHIVLVEPRAVGSCTEFIETMRAMHLGAPIDFILMTATPIADECARIEGFSRVLQKPFDAPDLLRVIRASEPGPSGSNPMHPAVTQQ